MILTMEQCKHLISDNSCDEFEFMFSPQGPVTKNDKNMLLEIDNNSMIVYNKHAIKNINDLISFKPV